MALDSLAFPCGVFEFVSLSFFSIEIVPPVVFNFIVEVTGSAILNLPNFWDLPFSPTNIIVVSSS